MRFRDPGTRWADFTDEILTRCPQCAGRALVVIAGNADRHRIHRPRRFLCEGCGRLRTWNAKVVTMRAARDPYFGLPVWLQTRCRGNLLWAYNERHLDLLERYISATLRERVPREHGEGALRRYEHVEPFTMLERLPVWMKNAGHRSDLLKAIHHLRTL